MADLISAHHMDSAKYDFFPIAPATTSRPLVTQLELATNVITDWLPGVPGSLAHGFSDLLGEMLTVARVEGDDLWIVGPRMSGFEKQWKLVTSWILGVAFCKKVIEELGYIWWAPVSAFNSKNRDIAIPYWNFAFPPAKCVVRRPNPFMLFPDYVLSRPSSNGFGYDVSFAESKGCKDSLTALADAPSDWKSQSQNAEFLFGGAALPITQYLLIATRVFPRGVRTKTRRIQVRAWNSAALADGVPLAAVRDVVLAHYFGVCERIGLPANAQLLALSNYSPLDNVQHKRMVELIARQRQTSMQEIRPQPLGQTQIYLGLPNSIFRVHDLVVQVGLSEPAMNLIQTLQQPNQQAEERLLESFQRDLAVSRKLLGSSDTVFLRNDGVVAMALTEGRLQ